MSNIDAYLEAALARMKVRASKFDSKGYLPMDEWVRRDGVAACMTNLLDRADSNLITFRENDREEGDTKHLLDAMNLIALVLYVEGWSDAKSLDE